MKLKGESRGAIQHEHRRGGGEGEPKKKRFSRSEERQP